MVIDTIGQAPLCDLAIDQECREDTSGAFALVMVTGNAECNRYWKTGGLEGERLTLLIDELTTVDRAVYFDYSVYMMRNSQRVAATIRL